jgi:hypothetical protein
MSIQFLLVALPPLRKMTTRMIAMILKPLPQQWQR